MILLFFGDGLKAREGAIPHAIEVRAHGIGPAWRELVNATRSVLTVNDESRVLQYFEMLRYGWARDRHPLRKAPDRHRSTREPLE